jgi:ankyrin repeat protein
VYSNKPLDLNAAVDAIAVDVDVKPYFDPKNRTPKPSDIIASCSGLVTIDCLSLVTKDRLSSVMEVPRPRRYGLVATPYNGPTLARGPHRNKSPGGLQLQLAHFSVQQYLKSDKIDPSWKHCMSEDHAMASNAKLCLAYCFAEGTVDRPFKRTASRQWTQYAMQGEAHENRLHPMILDFLLSKELERARFDWLRMNDEEPLRLVRTSSEKLVPLTIASRYGLYQTANSLLLRGTDPYQLCPLWRSALCAALSRSHHNIVELLLEHGVKPNMRSGQAELSIAISLHDSTELPRIFHALLQHGADINACDEIHGIPLIEAADRGHEGVVNTLLAMGANVNAVDSMENNAIRAAAARGYNKVVQILLEKKADVNSCGPPNGSPLMSASYRGHTEVVRTLLRHGADIYQQSSKLYFKNALEAACYDNNAKTFELLVAHSSETGSLNECLGLACDSGRTELVKILLKHKADVNVVSRFGSPLLAASTYGNEELVQLLLHHGADPNQAGVSSHAPLKSLTCRTPLVHIIEVHNSEARTESIDYIPTKQAARLRILEMLITAGADVNKPDGLGHTPLHYAVVSNSSESFKLIGTLVKASAVLDDVDESGQTPLIKAANIKAEEFEVERRVRVLLRAGAKTDIQDVYGKTALHYAAFYGWLQICTMLVEAGAKTDIPNIYSITPLHYAARGNRPEICTLLVKAGANIDIQDVNGKTALHQAARHGELGICITLLEAGAKTDIQDVSGETALTQPEAIFWSASGGRYEHRHPGH